MSLKIIAALLAGVLAMPGVALAGLEICNDTAMRHSVAVGYKSGDGWASEGWWNIEPGACKTPISGDLAYRYYYFRAEAAGRDFADENYVFCTERGAFTIEGDEDCQSRGYARAKFRRIDTGKSARSFTLTFADRVSVPVAPTSPTPAAPGRWGEPYASVTAVFQNCVNDTEATFCSFHADGTKFIVYDDGRTPNGVMQSLRGYLLGTPIEVSGDLAEIYDRTADMVLRRVRPRPWNRWDTMLGRMQGTWYAVDDPNSQFNIIGSELENIYDGTFGAREYLSMSDRCNQRQGGEFLLRTDEESGDVLCYSIEELGDFDMTLIYLPRGNFLQYRKLD